LARHYAGREPPAEIPLAPSEVEGSAARDLLLNSGAKLGPYEIVSAIGAGGMDEAYQARDAKLGRDGVLGDFEGSPLAVGPRQEAGASEELAENFALVGASASAAP